MDPLFLELLRIALGGNTSFRVKPTDAQWAALYKTARKQSVTGLTAQALERLPDDQLPPMELGRRWLGDRVRAARRNALSDTRASQLTAIFTEAGYRCCVLKGQGVARLYPDPSLRQSGDIDLWVIGDRDGILSFLRSRYPVGRHVYHHADVHFFEDMPVEIHFHPSFMYGLRRNRQLQRFFDEEAEAWDMEGGEETGFRYPKPLFDAVFSLSHIQKHIINEGVGLRQVTDHHFILRALTDADRVRYRDTARALGLGPVAAAMAFVEREVFGPLAADPVFTPDPVRGRRLLEDIDQSGNFGRMDDRKEGRVARWIRFLPDYPSEILSLPFRQLWEWTWRILKGYVRL